MNFVTLSPKSFAVFAFAFMIAVYSMANIKSETDSASKVVFVHPQYAADFSDDKVLVGASHNIFVGKVVRRIGNRERGVGPETQFEVEVAYNVKGNLRGVVTVNQQGGYKDGTLYVVANGNVSSPAKDARGYLLQLGSTYLFATRYNKQENWHTMNSYPGASKLLHDDPSASIDSLREFFAGDQRVNQLKTAYSNEILLEADIVNDNVRNSYKSRGDSTLE